ncbi:MAG TPA: septal ring lytic transglycosylase RlpA family protein [Candidatus Binataceae bacterium]|nr:septal ring lytic transglycosylase RlpA family protein [Candidatus Binataceae bacterium]
MRGRGTNRFVLATAALASIAVAACSTSRPIHSTPIAQQPVSQQPIESSMTGMASWYGPGFDGHRTATGEVYNQEELTAASTVIPLGSRVMVTNLKNGRAVQVRINDHGPYVKGRKIDLSHEAARTLGIVNPGTAPVRIDLLSQPDGTRRLGTPIRYYVQVGSFSQSSNARRVSDKFAAYYRDVRIDQVMAGARPFYRVRMGAFDTRDAACERANESARLGYPIVIVSE